MEHKNKTFLFFNKDGKIEKLFSRRYCFNIADVIENRFGSDFIKAYEETKKTPKIRLEEVQEDFSKLLVGDLDSINWKEQDYEAILEVYFFFLLYEQNAVWRQLISGNEILASITEILKKTFTSNPENISQIPS